MSSIFIYLGIYVAILLGIVFFVTRKETSEDFLISNRNRPGWQIMLSKFAGAIGVGWFVSYTGFAYSYGFNVFAVFIGVTIGFFVFAYWGVPRFYDIARTQNLYTQGGLVEVFTQSRLARWLSDGVAMTIQFLWLLIGIIGGGKIISEFGAIPYELAVIITSAVVLTYVLLAGYKAVIITDVFQAIIIFGLLTMMGFGIMKGTQISVVLDAAQSVQFMGMDALGFLLFGILSFFSSADRYQLVYAAKSKKGAMHGIALAFVPMMLVALVLFFVGIYVKAQGVPVDEALVFIVAVKEYLPAGLLSFAIVLFFAGLMSSADTGIYTIASHAALLRKNKNPVRSVRIATIVVVILATGVSLVFRSIIDVSVMVGGVTLILSIPMIYLLAGWRSARAFILAIIFGIVGTIIGVSIQGFNPSMAVYVLGGNALGIVTDWIIRKYHK